MKIKCIHCETIYKIEDGKCSTCGKRGGYVQEPKLKYIEGCQVHLEDTLVHTTGTEYQIKEIQAEGLIAIITKTLIPAAANKRAYISNTAIKEYKLKK